MQFSRLARKLIAWIAGAAILMGSMAPLMTQALERAPDARDAVLIEVCTAMGTMLVDAPRDGQEPRAPVDHAQQHCTYCSSSHVPALGMPPAASASFFGSTLRPGLPELFLKSPRPLFAWSTAQPRAPPSVS